jgi:carbon-monoxide dehydrogenase medium subunit
VKRFDYLAPTSLKEALTILQENPEISPLAGGTDLLIQIRENQRTVLGVMSLKRARGPECTINGYCPGSAVTVGRVAKDPMIQQDFTALAVSAGLIGSVQILNMATVGGNICNASPSADTAPALLVLGANVVIASTQGERTLPIEEFFLGPGKTILRSAELLKTIQIPQLEVHSGSFYYRFTPRARMDIAVVGVAAMLTLDEKGTIAKARIALGAVAPTPIRAYKAEGDLIGEPPSDELFTHAAEEAMKEAFPIDDLRGSAEYRRHLVKVLTQRALRQALARAEEDDGI